MNISDEAVEAAARAIADASPDWADGEWGNTAISDRFRDGTRAEARAALEAATPRPPLVQVVLLGCQDCSYNSKYGMICCKEHRGW